MAHSHNCLAQRIQLADAVTCFTLDGDDHDDDVKEVYIVPQQSVLKLVIMGQVVTNHDQSQKTRGGWIGVTSESAMLPLHCRADRTRVKIGLRAPLTRFQEQALASKPRFCSRHLL